jgi:hypothetical protein
MEDINAEYEWISNQNLKQFSGQWIAVFNKKIISSGEYAHEVAKKAKKQIKETPFLIKVPIEGYISV